MPNKSVRGKWNNRCSYFRWKLSSMLISRGIQNCLITNNYQLSHFLKKNRFKNLYVPEGWIGDCAENDWFTFVVNCCCELLPFCIDGFTGGGGWLRLGVVRMPCGCCCVGVGCCADWLPVDCCWVWLKLAAKLLKGGGSLVLGLCVVVVAPKPLPAKLLLEGKLPVDWKVFTDGNPELFVAPLCGGDFNWKTTTRFISYFSKLF